VSDAGIPPIDPARDHVRGGTGPYDLLLYGDYECPYTRRAMGFVRTLQQRYGDELRFAFRHLPITKYHPHAQHAAEAAESAAAQGDFWAMHDQLFAHPDALDDEQLPRHASAVGLDPERVAADLAAGRFAERVREDAQTARAAGIRGTPSFVTGGVRHEGFYDVETLAESLEWAAGR
jgi:Na+:H+ antiporter, NhaA family